MSRSPGRTESYHHGQLRRVLMDAALQEIAVGGTSQLSLRALARSAGVSHAAPAHHFKDKTGVFTALAIEGFQLLYEMQRGTSDALEPTATLVPLAVNYVVFAAEHPSHYEVMWRNDLLDTDDPELLQIRAKVFDLFYRSVAAGIGDSESEDFQGAVAAAWSIVHGFSTLWLSGNLDPILGSDPLAAIADVARGVIAIGRVTSEQVERP